MSSATPAELNDLVERIRGWEPTSRVLLARRILETLELPSINGPPRRLPRERIFGFFRVLED